MGGRSHLMEWMARATWQLLVGVPSVTLKFARMARATDLVMKDATFSESVMCNYEASPGNEC